MRKQSILLTTLLFMAFAVNAQWSIDPGQNLQVTNSTNEQVIPKVAVCPNGHYYIGYFSLENQNYNVRLQYLDSQGNILWQPNGILISNHTSMTWLTDWDMVADNENNAILTIQDIRLNGNNNIVAYKISNQGSFLWGADGIMLSNSEDFDAAPKVVVTGSNNVVVAWQANNVIIRQKISPEGSKLWGDWGITMSGTERFTWPQLMAVGADDVVMKFYKDTGSSMYPVRHLLAQRFNAEGQPVWSTNTVICNTGNISSWTQILSMVTDGNEGFYIAWHDYRLSGLIAAPWIQHVNNNGVIQYAANGLQLSDRNEFNRFNPRIAVDETGNNIFVFWRETNGDQNQYGLYAQNVSMTGQLQWTSSGKPIIDIGSENIECGFAVSEGSDAIVMYENGSGNIKIRRINSVGENVWSGIDKTVNSTTASKVHPSLSGFYNNQWILTWEETRNDQTDIYAQNFHPDGTLGNVVQTGTISGHVLVEGNMVNVQEIEILSEGNIINPDQNGNFIFTLEPGNYTLSFSHEFVIEQAIENVVVTANTTTNVAEIQLLMKRRTLTCHVVDQFNSPLTGGQVTIQGPENSYTFSSEETPHTIQSVPFGNYTGSAIYSSAVYETIESDTVINELNGDLYFHFLIGGVIPPDHSQSLEIYPNPVTMESVIGLNTTSGGYYTISLHTVTGTEISSFSTFLNSGHSTIEFKEICSFTLPSGVFFLKTVGQNEKVTTLLIVSE